MSRSEAETKFARLKWRRAFNNWERKAAQWIDAIKAGYDPNQPRVPAGNSDGGQWASSGGNGSGTSSRTDRSNTTGSKPRDFRNPDKPRVQLAQANSRKPKKTPGKKPKDVELEIPIKKIPRSSKKPLGPAPKLSKRKPKTIREQNRMVKEFTKWADQARRMLSPGQIKLLRQAVRRVPWLKPFYPFIQSYFDDPKPLDQLNKDAQTKRPGYERHHIVEQTPARQDGFGRDLVDAPENIVSVPKYKHEEISGRYQKKRLEYGQRSLRENLRGKSWEERRKAGLEVLEEFGVLGP